MRLHRRLITFVVGRRLSPARPTKLYIINYRCPCAFASLVARMPRPETLLPAIVFDLALIRGVQVPHGANFSVSVVCTT